MKILFVASESFPVPPVRGGAVETWIYEVAKRLKPDRVVVLSVDAPGLKDFTSSQNFILRIFRQNFLAKLMLCSWKLPFKKLRSFLYYLPFSFWAALQARKEKVDVIHLHTRPQFVPVLRFLNPEAKIILHLHNIATVEPEGHLWPSKFLNKVDLLAACSEYLRMEIVKRYPFFDTKSLVLYNGVSAEEFSPSEQARRAVREELGIEEDETVILYSGRLVEYKGAHILLDAFKEIAPKYPKARLLVLGGLTYSNNQETPYIRELKKSCSGLGERVRFLGYLDHKRMPSYLSAADIVVVPSLWEEPFGVVVIEGMAAGKCVIAFEKGGIKEIIQDGDNGLLLKKDSSFVLAEALDKMINSTSERQRLGENARSWVSNNFTWEKISQDVCNTYASLTNVSVKGKGSKNSLNLEGARHVT